MTALKRLARFKLGPVGAIAVLVIIYALFVINWLFGHLRFTSPRWNFLTLALSLLLPLAACFWLPKLPNRVGRITATVVLIPVSLASFGLCLLISCMIAPTIVPHDVDNTCVFVRSVKVDGPPVKAYITDAGAMTRYGIVVQQETTLLPGVIWVTPLCGEYPADDVAMTVLDRHHVRCSFSCYDDGYNDNLRPQPRVCIVKTLSLPWQR